MSEEVRSGVEVISRVDSHWYEDTDTNFYEVGVLDGYVVVWAVFTNDRSVRRMVFAQKDALAYHRTTPRTY